MKDQYVHLPGIRNESDDSLQTIPTEISKHDTCRCSKVDFHRILAEGGPEEYLCTLQYALDCLACKFCEYISELTIGLKSGTLDDESRDVECRVKRVIATADEFPQRMSTKPLARVLLILRGRLSGGSFGVHTTSFTLDYIPSDRSLPANSGLCTLYRRPIERQFDPKLLRRWLDRSNRSQAYWKQSHSSQQDASFRQLLKTGKFRIVDVLHRKVISITRPIQFLALSYVWGRSMTNYAAVLSITKERTNKIDWENCIDWRQILRTVNDAIELTRRIGERYIWIDSLCIDQFNAEEKGFLISQMVRYHAPLGSSRIRHVTKLLLHCVTHVLHFLTHLLIVNISDFREAFLLMHI